MRERERERDSIQVPRDEAASELCHKRAHESKKEENNHDKISRENQGTTTIDR